MLGGLSNIPSVKWKGFMNQPSEYRFSKIRFASIIFESLLQSNYVSLGGGLGDISSFLLLLLWKMKLPTRSRFNLAGS